MQGLLGTSGCVTSVGESPFDSFNTWSLRNMFRLVAGDDPAVTIACGCLRQACDQVKKMDRFTEGGFQQIACFDGILVVASICARPNLVDLQQAGFPSTWSEE